jgi:amino acid permease
MKNSCVAILASIIGLFCFVIAYIYFTHSAGTLPHYFPGYENGVTTIHSKHAIGMFILGLAAFVLAWFKSGKKQ